MSEPFALDTESLQTLRSALEKLEAGFAKLPAGAPSKAQPGLEAVLDRVAIRLHDNFPYFHPLYAGQMLKPPHPVARLAYALAMWINPNNHALDGGRASSQMEREAVAEIAGMFGWRDYLGHLCGGGTMANLEALWVAGQGDSGPVVVASEQAHYTHERISRVLGFAFEPIPCDRRGRMDPGALASRLERGDIGTVVATAGTTGGGAMDPVPEILALREKHGFHLHVDAAYGGYFTLIDGLAEETRRVFDALPWVDSIVIDPHKHGLQPYGCGCVLFRDPAVGRFYKHDSPYTYFSSSDLHLGEISLECSRPGASAVALWATQKLLPLARGGEFAGGLMQSRKAAVAFHERLRADRRFLTPFAPELDIVAWAPVAPTVSQASARSQALFQEAAERGLHLALARWPVKFFDLEGARVERDQPEITCLRSVLMKPEHLAWLDRIWEILDAAATTVLKGEREAS